MTKIENEIFKIKNMIYLIRDHKVMLDSDLALLYGVETKVLNQQVKRNLFTKLRSFHALETNLSGEVKELKENSNKLFKVIFERLDSIEDDLIPKLPNHRKKIGINANE